jgi:hypothetical protein
MMHMADDTVMPPFLPSDFYSFFLKGPAHDLKARGGWRCCYRSAWLEDASKWL